MGESQGGQRLVAVSEIPQQGNGAHQLFADQPQGVIENDQIGVVPHIAASGSQVDDPLGGGTLDPVGVDVGHHVVADLLFPGGGHLVVDILHVGLQFGNLPVGTG